MSSQMAKKVSRVKREPTQNASQSAGAQSHANVSGSAEAASRHRSPRKTGKHHESEEDEYDSESDASELKDFIVDDQEVAVDEDQQDGGSTIRQKRRKHKKRKEIRLDDEDLAMIQENTGIALKKKSRLKRVADKDDTQPAASSKIKKEIEVAKSEQYSSNDEDNNSSTHLQKNGAQFQKQTKSKKSKQSQAVKEYDEDLRRERLEKMQDMSSAQIEKMRQAVEIFGEGNEYEDARKVAGVTKADEEFGSAAEDVDQLMEDHFDADEIDDPFSTAADKKIAEVDIPERLQVRFRERTLEPTEMELSQEADWIQDKLVAHATSNFKDSGPDKQLEFKYSRLLRQKDSKQKIFKVLSLLRKKLYDVPMIAKYRQYEYAEELDEDAIWIIYGLDQEYGKFQRHKKQISDFLTKVSQIEPAAKQFLDELSYAKTTSDLNNFNSLISFLCSYYSEKLGNQNFGGAQSSNETGQTRKKQPQQRDEIMIAKQNGIHEFTSKFALSWAQYLENVEVKKMKHEPPRPSENPLAMATKYLNNDNYSNVYNVHKAVCKFAAIELSAQPLIRHKMKTLLEQNATISTVLTDQGKKDLDLFNLSYRVKLVQNLPLQKLRNQSDLYLEVLQCEKAGQITVQIKIDAVKLKSFKDFLLELYMVAEAADPWNIMRKEIIEILVDQLLMKEIQKELRDEIREEAEAFVISRCKQVYKDMLMTGPYATQDGDSQVNEPPQEITTNKKSKKIEPELIKDRERLNVMGTFMHQIDLNNYVVTVAVVDRYGELVAHKDFIRLLPPRVRKFNRQRGDDNQLQQIGTNQFGQQESGTAVDGDEKGGVVSTKTDEEVQHGRDKERFMDLLETHSVDLIVVAANSLEATKLKKCLNTLAGETKQRGTSRKEAHVIWGATEVPKLFSISHNSQRLHKNTQQMLKQAIALARFEQDPLCEFLNLWSPIIAENQALSLTLDHMQKWVNQSRLAEGLEEINVQVVNEVGIDLNLLADHEHMHAMLQFVSGFGPRKSKKFLAKFKGMGKKLTTRGEIFKASLLQKEVYFSATAFLKIRIPREDMQSGVVHSSDLLDQTRIHHESYRTTYQIAKDAIMTDDQGQEVDRQAQTNMLKEVIADPGKLKGLDLKQYYQNLEAQGQANFSKLVEKIITELTNPFKDPRTFRTSNSMEISNEKLFYLLIDEQKRTFKRGLIVTATVSKVLDSKVICRLDNGLSAIILSSNLISENTNKKLRDMIEQGHTIQGRLDTIKTDNPDQFEVTLDCKKSSLQDHRAYKKELAESLGINEEQILEEDLRNVHFTSESRAKQVGKYVPRRIAHEKFKNISSRRALQELTEAQDGDFVFRPSTRAEDKITLTWRFWKKNFVHIDIQEQEKPKGAVIGSKLVISNDQFDSLREIVERYIIPCNRLVRDAKSHTKFFDCDTYEELESQIRAEKLEKPQGIPYRFSILREYPQHIVLAYMPKEKVIKEFIKVRPKGFYFHEQSHNPFQQMINWFKDNWSKREYLRIVKRQRSPRVQARPALAEGDANGSNQMAQNNNASQSNQMQQNDWASGMGSQQPMKAERSQAGGFGDNNTNAGGGGGASWGNSENTGFKHEPRQQSPDNNGGYQNNGGERRGGGGSINCFNCKEEGHMSRECPKPREERPARRTDCFRCGQEGHRIADCPNEDTRPEKKQFSKECYNCKQEGHISRDCPNPDTRRGGDRDRDRDRDGGRDNYHRSRHTNNNNFDRSDNFDRRNNYNDENGGGAAGWGSSDVPMKNDSADNVNNHQSGSGSGQGAQAAAWGASDTPQEKNDGAAGGGWGA